jgi:DNA-directed RNA polymerase II subunit RPB4
MKMQAYLDTFSRFKERAQLDELESLLIPFPQLEFFERAQLRAFFPAPETKEELTEEKVSLCPGDHEEAKTLIPSIADKISDDELQQLVQDIASARAR